MSFRSRGACHLTQTNHSGKSSEHQVFHICTWCMAIFGVTSQGTKYRERLATNIKLERLRYASILTQDTWSLSLTTNINKFVYALHAYFLIGLRCPSGNNKRAMGVTDDSEVQSTMEQERTGYSPFLLCTFSSLRKKKLWFVVFAFLTCMKCSRWPSLLQCPTRLKNIYDLRQTKISYY